jgi:protein arginine kinase
MKPWYLVGGPESDAILSTRIRIARNFSDLRFPPNAKKEEKEIVIQKVKDAVFSGNSENDLEFTLLEVKNLNEVDRQVLVEKHLISPDLAKNNSGAVILSKDENISIMINEEDHIRIQCMFPGLDFENAYSLSLKIDKLICEKSNYAFHQQFGYLTSCPTNVGTGIRASIMAHLPALTKSGYIKGILEACGKLNIAVRGIYGENTMSLGNIYQISNEVTLGHTEDEIIHDIKEIALQIAGQERLVRQQMLDQNATFLEDQIFRSYGILKNARILTSQECSKLLSDLRMGITTGLLNSIELELFNKIFLQSKKGNLQKYYKTQMNSENRDIKRAEMVRKMLG